MAAGLRTVPPENTTQKHYDDLLERIKPALGHLKLSEITPLHINAFYKNLAEEGIRIDYKYKCRIDFRKFLKDNDISRYKLIDAAGISMTTLESIVAGKNVSKETALGISNALEIEPEELFDVIGTDKLFRRNAASLPQVPFGYPVKGSQVGIAVLKSMRTCRSS